MVVLATRTATRPGGPHRGPRAVGVVRGDQLEDRFVLARVIGAEPEPRFSRRMSISALPIESISSRKSSLWVARAITRWNSRSSRAAARRRRSLCMRSWISRSGARRLRRSRARRRARRGAPRGPCAPRAPSRSRAFPTQIQAHRLAHGVRVDRCDAQPAARADLDHALRDERAHRLAHDGPRDAELLSELALGREPVADLEPAFERIVSSIISATLSERRGSRVTCPNSRLRAFEASVVAGRPYERSYVIQHAPHSWTDWHAVV